MTNSLLKTILLQTDKPRLRIEDQESLNKELQEKTAKGLIFSKLVGGLGKTYKKIAPFLTISEEVITELNAPELAKFAHATFLMACESNDKKGIYKAGLCFALVAVYGDNVALQLNAYKQLSILFQKSYLADDEMRVRCEGYLKSASLDAFSISHREIIWSWAIEGELGAKAVDTFETARHKKIMGYSDKSFITQVSLFTPSIDQAFLLLGLSDSADLKVSDINDACKSCETQVRKHAKIAPSDANEHPFIKNFKKAELLLEHYINLKNFNSVSDFKTLATKLKAVEKAALSDGAAFIAANELLCLLDIKIKAVTGKILQDLREGRDLGESPYTTKSMIKNRLGEYVYTYQGRTFEVQVRLDAQAKLYWDSFCTKLNPLFTSAIILNNRTITAALVTEIQQLCLQIEHALSIVDAIKGDALSESSVVTAVATDIDTVCNKLNESLDTLKNKIAIHDQNIKNTVKNIVELNQKAGKEDAVSLEVENPNNLITHCKSMMALTKEYSHWLATLDPRSKSIAEKEFQLYIISQASIESVVDPLCTMLNKVPLNNLKTALKSFMGAKYNDRLPLRDVLTSYFKAKKDENLQALIIAFVSEIKALVNEQSDIKADITGKDLVPPATYMSLVYAAQNLTENDVKFTAKSEQLINELNNELQIAIEPLLERYKSAERDISNILAEKNSLNFSWKKNMATLFSCQKLLEEDYQKIEILFQNQAYLTPAVSVLVASLRGANLDFNQKFTQLNKKVGDTGLDTLKFLILKNRIKHEKVLYLAQGEHHSDRHESLDRLSEKYEALEGKNTDTRFVDLLEAIEREQVETGASHQRIGFLGGLRPSRLQKTYSKLISESENLAAVFPSDLWKPVDFNLDSMKYIALKQRIQQERELYLLKGAHHKERHESLQRLEEQIGFLDSDESNEENRFPALLAAVYKEAIATDSSQKRIGFFGGLKECRLQKIYTKIIDDALVFDSSAAELTYDVSSEDVDNSFNLPL